MIVRTSGVCRKSSPISRSPQIWMNCRTATVTIAGIASGIMTAVKTCRYEAPSMSDASMSSSGTPRKYVVIRYVPNGMPSAA